MFKDDLLAGRRILVTGGGTGLGKAMAAKFLALGAEIHICGRRKGVCEETATELMAAHGGKVTAHGVDIRDAAAVDAMIAAMLEARERADFVPAVRALDRALIAGFYAIPVYNIQQQWIARWNRIERPKATALTGYLPETWWQKPDGKNPQAKNP